jgi:hypothetical protein
MPTTPKPDSKKDTAASRPPLPSPERLAEDIREMEQLILEVRRRDEERKNGGDAGSQERGEQAGAGGEQGWFKIYEDPQESTEPVDEAEADKENPK